MSVLHSLIRTRYFLPPRCSQLSVIICRPRYVVSLRCPWQWTPSAMSESAK
jgi:hypothetical protein